MNYPLQVVTTKHSESARELFEHLDCKGDQRGLAILDELLEYTTMLVQLLNEWRREHNGEPDKIRRAESSRAA